MGKGITAKKQIKEAAPDEAANGVTKNRKKIFYGWIIVGIGMLMMATTVGIVFNCFSLYIVPICDELSFTRRQGAVMNTLFSVGSMLVSAFSAKLYGAVPVKRTMRVAAVILPAAYACFCVARSLWAFYLISLVVATALWSLSYIPFAVVLNNWFHRRTGFMIGLTYMGTGLGGMIFNPVIGRLIETVGWRSSIAIMSAAIAAVAIPCSLLIKDSPEEMGLQPYGESVGSAVLAANSANAGVAFADAIKTPRFYLIAAGVSLMGFVGTGFYATFASYLSDMNYPIMKISLLMSAIMAALAVGKISLGGIFDNMGALWGSLLAAGFMTASLIGSLLLPGAVASAVTVAGLSLGLAFGSVAAPIISRAGFGMKDFRRVNGSLSTISGIVQAFAPPFCGWVCDAAGSYAYSYMAFIAVMLVAAALLAVALKKGREA